MPMQIFRLPIARLVDEAPGVRTFLFDVPAGLTWEPGAHLHVGLPGFDADGERHPELVRHMSVCTLPEEGALGFTTRLNSSDSQFKRTLGPMGVGDSVALFKFGSILGLPDDGRPVVLLSQGVGIASMRPLLLSYAHRKAAGELAATPSLTSITVDAGERAIYGEELAGLSAEGLVQRRVTGRAEFAEAVRELGGLGELGELGDPAGSLFEVVGSDGFLASTISLLRGLGVADGSIVLDKMEAKRAPFFEA